MNNKMKSVDEIIDYIDKADKWTAEKEKGLICRMGGGKIINGRFHAKPNYHDMADNRIRKAKRKLEKRDTETSWEDFQQEVAAMFANDWRKYIRGLYCP